MRGFGGGWALTSLLFPYYTPRWDVALMEARSRATRTGRRYVVRRSRLFSTWLVVPKAQQSIEEVPC